MDTHSKVTESTDRIKMDKEGGGRKGANAEDTRM